MLFRSGRGTFDRGDLKEMAGSPLYGATIDSLCNEVFAGGLIAFREGNSALQWLPLDLEDITLAVAVAVGPLRCVLGMLSSLGVQVPRPT